MSTHLSHTSTSDCRLYTKSYISNMKPSTDTQVRSSSSSFSPNFPTSVPTVVPAVSLIHPSVFRSVVPKEGALRMGHVCLKICSTYKTLGDIYINKKFFF